MRRRTAAVLAVLLAALGMRCALPTIDDPGDPMLHGDVADLFVFGRAAEIVPFAPWLIAGLDGEFGTPDDRILAHVRGDMDLVARTGITGFAGPIPDPTASGGPGALSPAVAEPLGGGVAVPFVVAATDGDPGIPYGSPVAPPSLEGAPVLVVAFADLDGDGWIGVTNLDGDPFDLAIEDAERVPIARRMAIASGGVASGSLAIPAGGPPGAELTVLVGAAAYAGPFDPAFFGGMVPDGPAVMTQLPMLPRTAPDRVIQAGPAGPGPADPNDLAAVEIQAAFDPDPNDPRVGESFTLSTDGSEPTVDGALAASGAFARFALAQVPDPATFVAMPARPLRPGFDDAFARTLYEVLSRVHVPDDGAASAVTVRVVPVDRLGNIASLPAAATVTVRTGGLVRIVSPDTDGDPFAESVLVADVRGAELVLDDPGGALDGPDADLLTVEGAGELAILDAALPDPDVDDSGLVDATDLLLVEAAGGARLGAPAFDPKLDVNGDGRVNGGDEAAVQAALGSTVAVP